VNALVTVLKAPFRLPYLTALKGTTVAVVGMAIVLVAALSCAWRKYAGAV
jgi:hypothetical protein